MPRATGVQYLALLRGINVGGKNKVPMADLRGAFEEIRIAGAGLTDVATYINSGNVLFRAPRQRREALAARIEKALTERFGIELKVVLVTEARLRSIVEDAPRSGGFGADTHRSDVIFLRGRLTAKRAAGLFETKEGVDRVWAGKGVVYFSRLTARATASRMGNIVAFPEYKEMTIRSWGTTTKLLELMDERA
jgi:uncharacterized protein (DUF1697 family)